MLVKKTKSGKVSLTLNNSERDKILYALVNYLESESVAISFLKMSNEKEVMRSIYFYALTEIVTDKDFSLHNFIDIKWVLTKTQALSLMWLLRGYDHDMALVDIKSGLHKLYI